ncbi:MAG TPA: O-antigen ligase family protein [Gemmatimonadaceae bacterium]|nr:O-antigen ligase family protein [Gemmatimonadaceae bacterium]
MTVSALRFPIIATFRAPRISRVALILFFWLLPFHSLIIALLFGYFGVSANLARAIAAWKEAAIVVLLFWVIIRSLSGRGRQTAVISTDIAVGGLLVLAIVSLLIADPLFHASIPVGAELYGFRDSFFFMLLYFIGRSMPELAESETVIKHSYYLALIVSVVGIVERIFVTPDMLVLLGVASYMNDFLGLAAYTSNNVYGLPANYWTDMGGVAVRRSGSVFLHSQGFALPFLFLMPAASAWALSRKRSHPHVVRFGYVLIWAGLLTSITRMTTVICVIQVVLFYLMMRRPEWALGSVATALGAIAITVVVVPGLMHFVWETLSWQTGSNASHARDWGAGLLAVLEQPWGHGVGTTDSAPLRFLREPLSADSMYLSYGVQLGVLGLFTFLAMIGGILAASWRGAWTAVTDTRRRFFAVIALAGLGIFLNGVTSVVFSSNLFAYVFFLCAGAAMTAVSESPASSGLSIKG